MQHRIARCLAIATVATAATAALGAARAPDARPASPPMTNANILAHMMEGDSLEVEISRSGVDSAKNLEVKRFAERMVTTHTKHMDEVKAAASKAKVTPERAAGDTATGAMGERMIDRLKGKPGAARDHQLMESEVTFHEQLLHDLETARSDATGPTKDLVEETLPVVRHHLDDARAILRKLGTSS